MVSNTHSLKFLCCFADNIIAQFTIEILPFLSPLKGEVDASVASRRRGVIKEKNHEKNNSGAGVGGVTECV